MTDLPAPLTPSDCDLRDYPWMPVDCTRLLTSETWMLGTAEQKVAAFTLWAKSWHQVPAGSLPSHDKMLEVMSEAGPAWKRVREHALRGWVKCSDGRLYHPVVAEKANESWRLKLAQRARTEAARAAKAAKKAGNAAPAADSVTDNATDSEAGNHAAAPPSENEADCVTALYPYGAVTHSDSAYTGTGAGQVLEIGQSPFLSQSLSQAPPDQTRPDQERKKERTPLAGGSARARGRGLVPLPQDWRPTEFAEPPLDHAAVLARFTDWHRAHGTTSADWDAKWRLWLADEPGRRKPPLHTLPQAEQDRRILTAAGALGFEDPPPAPVVPLRIAQ